VDTFVLRDGCPSGGYLMPNLLALHTSVDHRPRLELTTSDRPIVNVLYAGPRGGPNATGQAGSIVIHAEVSTPWGKQDVAGVQLTIMGPGEAYSVARLETLTMTHCHCPPTPLQATWLWDAVYDQAPPGRYEVTVTATNLQGTATTVATVPLELRYEQTAPAATAPSMVAGLAVVALALHRRR
jgi:MYXO-CTERM domain-containing protein